MRGGEGKGKGRKGGKGRKEGKIRDKKEEGGKSPFSPSEECLPAALLHFLCSLSPPQFSIIYARRETSSIAPEQQGAWKLSGECVPLH